VRRALDYGESCSLDSVVLLMRTEKRKIAVRVVVMIKILEKGLGRLLKSIGRAGC
jgi:hypothetical protein